MTQDFSGMLHFAKSTVTVRMFRDLSRYDAGRRDLFIIDGMYEIHGAGGSSRFLLHRM